MTRKLITTVFVGGAGLVFSVYVAVAPTVAQQDADMEDAGLSPPNRNATCPVRLDEDFARDAGLKVYQRLLFPVVLAVLPDAGRDIQMPPMPLQRARQSIDVVDWNDCTLAASTLAVRNLWGTRRPFSVVPATSRPWCRQKADAGLPCVLLDGGAFGDMNVSLCSLRANPATCERVSGGGIFYGDDEEDL